MLKIINIVYCYVTDCPYIASRNKGDTEKPRAVSSRQRAGAQKTKTMAKVVNKSGICKASIFIGLNDKDSKVQEISTLEAAKFIQREICKLYDGGTVSEATGIYRHSDGSGAVVVENTLKIEILFFGMSRTEVRAEVLPFIDDAKRFLNQETVALQLEEIESELI